MSSFVAFILGTFASFLASKVFQIYNNSNRPNIKISHNLIKKTNSNNNETVTLKLINRTNQDLCNVEIRLDGMINMSAEGNIALFSSEEIAKCSIFMIKAFDKKDEKNSLYAHRVHLKSNHTLLDNEKYDTFKISIFATCPYYGTASISEKVYSKKDILSSSYSFNTGNDVNCSSNG